MNGSLQVVLIPIAAIGSLLAIAYFFDRRARNKGNLISGEKQALIPALGQKLYIFLAIFLVGSGVIFWGFTMQSGIVQLIGLIIILVAIGLRGYWMFRTLLEDSKK